jgi:hypothetical protein
LRSVHRHDGNFNVVADPQRLTGSSGQYQHKFASLLWVFGCLMAFPKNCSPAETATMWVYGSIGCRTLEDSIRSQ